MLNSWMLDMKKPEAPGLERSGFFVWLGEV